jgi:hypothetical protein
MGMFDSLQVQIPLPGLEDSSSIKFQTKDLENCLEVYRITPDGVLEIEEYDVEDRSDPNATGLSRIIGMATRIPTGWRAVDYSGNVTFYGDKNSGELFLIYPDGRVNILGADGVEEARPAAEWFEYTATFDHGRILSIERCRSARGC